MILVLIFQRPEWIVQSQADLVENWCFPPDLDTFYETCTTLAKFFFNNVRYVYALLVTGSVSLIPNLQQTSLEFQNEVSAMRSI